MTAHTFIIKRNNYLCLYFLLLLSHTWLGATCTLGQLQSTTTTTITTRQIYWLANSPCLAVAQDGNLALYPYTACGSGVANNYPAVCKYAGTPLAYINQGSTNLLAMLGNDSQLHIYNVDTNLANLGSQTQAFPIPAYGNVVVSSDDSKYLAVIGGGPTPTLSTFTVNASGVVSAAATLNTTSLWGTGGLPQVGISPSTAPCRFLLATTGQTNSAPYLIPLNTDGTLGTPTAVTAAQTAGAPQCMAFSPNGQWVAIGYLYTNMLYIFQITNCGLSLLETQIAPSNDSGPWALTYSSDNSCLIAAYGSSVATFTLNSNGTINQSLNTTTARSTTRSLSCANGGCGSVLAASGNNAFDVYVLS